jgi:hypothetical protein
LENKAFPSFYVHDFLTSAFFLSSNSPCSSVWKNEIEW